MPLDTPGTECFVGLIGQSMAIPGYVRHRTFLLEGPGTDHSWISQAMAIYVQALTVPAGHARYWPFLNTPDFDRCQISLAQAVTAKTGQAMIVRNRLINLPGGDTS